MKETREKQRVVEMPNYPNAEKLVLGHFLNYPRTFAGVAEKLQPDDFYGHRCKSLYTFMLNYYREHGECADYIATCEALFGDENVSADDVMELKMLRDDLVYFDLQQNIRLILGASRQRSYIYASQKLGAIGFQVADPEKGQQAVEKLLYDLVLDRHPESDFSSIEDILADCMSDTETAYKMRGQILGVPTGFNDLDRMFSGLQRSDLIILAGRPAMGKTALGVNIGYNAAHRGMTVAIFSLEMGKKQLGTRLLSLVSRISSTRIRSGWLDEDDWTKLVEAQDILGGLNIHIDDTSGAPVTSIRSKLLRLQAKIKRPVDLVIIDYLQLMEDENTEGSRFENRTQEISKISRGLKALAREFNVPVLALAQLSRAVESRQSKIPQLSDLRESGSLEQDADVVAFVYRDEYYNPQSERKGMADVIVAKHRNGETGTVTLAFNGSLTRFDNLEDVPAPEY